MTLEELKKEKVKPGTLKENFFLPPENIDVGDLQMYEQGVLLGVINGKFYGGATTTWNQSNTYGMFGTPADGNYVLAPQFIITKVQNDHFITAYESNKRQFVRVNLYGGAMYFAVHVGWPQAAHWQLFSYLVLGFSGLVLVMQPVPGWSVRVREAHP